MNTSSRSLHAPALFAVALGLHLSLAARAEGRYVGVDFLTQGANSLAAVPVRLTTEGNENSLAFSLAYDPALGGVIGVVPGPDAPADLSLVVNTNLAAQGRVGVLAGRAAGLTFAHGTLELLRVTWRGRGVPSQMPVEFDDVPVRREIVDAQARPLPWSFLPGEVTWQPSVVGMVQVVGPTNRMVAGVGMQAQGIENALGFTVVFDPAKASFVRAAPVPALPTLSIVVNTNEATAGRVGVIASLPAGSTLPAGIIPVLSLVWRTNATPVSLAFTDGPVRREVADVDGKAVTTVFRDGLEGIQAYQTPLIVNPPQRVLVPMGLPARFEVLARGEAPLRYQWQFKRVNLPGATNTVLAIPQVTAAHAGKYRVVVQNDYGSATSAEVDLTLDEPARVDIAPEGLDVMVGTDARLVSLGGGVGPVSYLWRKDGVVLPGATNAILHLTNVTPAAAGPYTVEVANSLGGAVSAPATVRVVEQPAVFSAPPNTVVSPGGTLKLLIGATGSEPVTYQWRHNGMPIPDATNTVLEISPVTLGDGGTYTVVVGNPWGVVETPPAVVTIQGVGPLYLSDGYEARPVYGTAQQLGWTNNLNATGQAGEPLHAGKVGGKSLWLGWVAPAKGLATFRTTGSSFDTLLAVYTAGPWAGIGSRKVTADEDRGGYLTSEVTFSAEAGQEYAIAVDGYAGATGMVVLGWSFEPMAESLPVIVSQSPSQVALQGTPVTLDVQATGGGLTYQWLRNGQALPGAIASQLSLGPVSVDVAGTYTVQVSNGAGLSVLSADIVVEVALNVAALGPVSRDKWPDLFLSQGARLQGLGGGGYLALALGQPGAREQSASSAQGESNEGSLCEAMGGAGRWLWLRPEADGVLKLDTAGSEVRDDFGNPLSVLLGVYEYHPGAPLLERGCDPEGTGVLLEVARGQDLVVQMNTVVGKGTVRLNWNLAATGGLWRGWGVRDGRFWVEEPVSPGKWRLDMGDNLQRWKGIHEREVRSGLFQYSEPFSPDIRVRVFRLHELNSEGN